MITDSHGNLLKDCCKSSEKRHCNRKINISIDVLIFKNKTLAKNIGITNAIIKYGFIVCMAELITMLYDNDFLLGYEPKESLETFLKFGKKSVPVW